jgi:hypothetical protein
MTGDAFDDATGEDAPAEDVAIEGSEGGWLVDSDEASTLDVGGLDVALAAEGKILDDDEPDASRAFDEPTTGDESFTTDSGEEGPLAEDEELREEDLPALDADEDGDVADEELYDRSMLGVDEELRWDDRAWARISAPSPLADEVDDSGTLAVPGEDRAQGARDATWRRLDDTGRVMAGTFVPGGSVVVALATPDRSGALLVRIQPDGSARIIAEIERRPTGSEDDEDACEVAQLRWDASSGSLVVGGRFGVQAFRPA